MAINKRLINTTVSGGGDSCTTDTLQILGDSSCVAYYKMSDATDEKGSNDGTPSNVNFNVAGKYGNAGQFNGQSNGSEIDCGTSGTFSPPTPQGTGFLSMSMWVKTTSTTAGYLISKGNNTAIDYEWAMEYSGSALSMNALNNARGFAAQTGYTTTINDGSWHHIVGMIEDGQKTTLIIDNGTPVTSTGWTGNAAHYSNAKMIIGGFMGITASTAHWEGEIDQVRIFNKLLSSDEVTTLYNEVQCLPTIVPTANFNTVLYEGNDGTNPRTDVGFQPDFIWLKNRETGVSHCLFDSIRLAGTANQLYSDSSNAEGQDTALTNLVSFDTSGFTLGATSQYNVSNKSTNDYVAWNWYAPTAQTNNSGTNGATITSTIKKNVDAGFSIVSYTGNSTAGAKIAHGLSSKPELIFIKNRTNANDWIAWCNLEPEQLAYLNHTDSFAASRYSFFLNSSQPTDTLITLGGDVAVNTSYDYIAYCFHSIDGMSRVGSYVGTSATGNNIVTGFRPAFVMLKRTDIAGSWNIIDNRRGNDNYLTANSDAVEGSMTTGSFDLASNGFILNNSFGEWNALNGKYIFLALAEEVFTPITRNATNPFGDGSELALYKFEDDADDAEGNYNGAWGGTESYATGYIDKAAVFNGSSSIIRTNLNSGSNNLTYSAWINITATPSQAYGSIVDGRKHFYTFLAIGQNRKVWLSNDQQVSGDTGDSGYATESATVLSLGVWYHIVGTLSSTSGAKIYINGNLNNTSPNRTTDAPDQDSTSCIGSRDGSKPFNGKIDQVRVFNKVLDDGEVMALYLE